jgi:hypothetical protein
LETSVSENAAKGSTTKGRFLVAAPLGIRQGNSGTGSQVSQSTANEGRQAAAWIVFRIPLPQKVEVGLAGGASIDHTRKILGEIVSISGIVDAK